MHNLIWTEVDLRDFAETGLAVQCGVVDREISSNEVPSALIESLN